MATASAATTILASRLIMIAALGYWEKMSRRYSLIPAK